MGLYKTAFDINDRVRVRRWQDGERAGFVRQIAISDPAVEYQVAGDGGEELGWFEESEIGRVPEVPRFEYGEQVRFRGGSWHEIWEVARPLAGVVRSPGDLTVRLIRREGAKLVSFEGSVKDSERVEWEMRLGKLTMVLVPKGAPGGYPGYVLSAEEAGWLAGDPNMGCVVLARAAHDAYAWGEANR